MCSFSEAPPCDVGCVHPELLKVSRQFELDFMSRSGVYRKQPRTWATYFGIPAIPTRWLDVNKEDAKQPKYRFRLCGKELKRWGPTVPGTSAPIGSFEYVVFLFSGAMTWRSGASGSLPRKVMFLDASRVHCWPDAVSEMAIELPPEEQVKGEDLVGEFLRSLYGTRKTARNWDKK